MGRTFKDTIKSVGRHLTLENVRKTIGIGQSAVNVIRHLKGNSNENVRKVVDKIPVDNIQTALDIGKGVHHVVNTRNGGTPTSYEASNKLPDVSAIGTSVGNPPPYSRRALPPRPSNVRLIDRNSPQGQDIQATRIARSVGR